MKTEKPEHRPKPTPKPYKPKTLGRQLELEIRKKVNEYRSKTTDCDTLLDSLRFKKSDLRDKRRSADSTEAIQAEHDISMVRHDESILETKRQCHVQTMHDFDSLLDMV